MARKRINKRLLYAFLSLLLLVVSIIGGWGFLPAFADTSEYTSAYTDLQKDSSFNVSDYPANSKDYSIHIIQVAESVDGELFIYTYQPCQYSYSLTATEVNMSLSEDFAINSKRDTVIDVIENTEGSSSGENGNGEGGNVGGGFGGGGGSGRSRSAASTDLFGLTLLNSWGVFCKYKVTGFTVYGDGVRYYNITSIYREFIRGVDSEADNDNTVNAVSFPVGQIWKVKTVAGKIEYEMKEVETVEITSKYVGTVRYSNGTKWFTSGACDSHFVAFSTDKRIDRLLEADVTYVSQTYDKTLSGTKHGNIETHTVGLTYDQKAGNTANGLFAKSYEWYRIQSVNEFISDVKPNDDIREKLDGKQWVLNFAETSYTVGTGLGTAVVVGWLGVILGSQNQSGTNVSDVSILRLKFETDGQVYNLGAVDNKQTGSGIPIIPNSPNTSNGKFDFWKFLINCFKQCIAGNPKWWQIAVVVVSCAVVLSVVAIVYAWLRWLVKKFKGE